MLGNVIQYQMYYKPPTTFTPVMSLVGGAGNVVPVYSTNYGISTVTGSLCAVRVQFFGDGGAEGAGTGTITISLLEAPSTVSQFLFSHAVVGYYGNGAITFGPLIVLPDISGAKTMSLYKKDSIAGVDQSTYSAMVGDDQNNTSRSINIDFSYGI